MKIFFRNPFKIYSLLFLILTACGESRTEPEAERENPHGEAISAPPADSLYFRYQDRMQGGEVMQQQMTAYFLHADTLWFSLSYDNIMAGGKLKAKASRLLDSNREYYIPHGEQQVPAYAYSLQRGRFEHILLIAKKDSALARLNTHSELGTDAIPMMVNMTRED